MPSSLEALSQAKDMMKAAFRTIGRQTCIYQHGTKPRVPTASPASGLSEPISREKNPDNQDSLQTPGNDPLAIGAPGFR
jgi:hypothetical protein